MRRGGGRKPLKAPAAVPPTHKNFWEGPGISLAATTGSDGRNVRVGSQTFKELRAVPNQKVIVHESGNPESARLYHLLPSNKVDKGMISCDYFSGKKILLRAVPETALSASELFALTAVLTTSEENTEAIPPTGLSCHIIQSLIKNEVYGRVFTNSKNSYSVTIHVLGCSLIYNITPVAVTLDVPYTWVGDDTIICINEPPSDSKVNTCSDISVLKPYLSSRKINCNRATGVVVSGVSGIGKSYFSEMVVKQSGWPVVNITGSALAAQGDLTDIIDRVKVYRDTGNFIILLDDLEDFFKSSTGLPSASSLSSLLEVFISDFLDEKLSCECLVMACVTSLSQLPSSLSRNGRLDITVELQPPSNAIERERLIESVCSSNKYKDSSLMSDIATRTSGFLAVDYTALVAAAKVHGGGLQENIKRVRPSALQSIEVSIPTTRWSDVGGQSHAKQLLKECVEWPLLHGELFSKMNIKPPSGILLFGPPGCSKTLLAKALATECTYNFIAVKGPELYNKWVGESEKAVRDVFAKARSAAPCIVFFDEIDGMCGKRGGGGVTDRVISQFLTEMDGLPNHKAIQSNHQVVVLAATNRPDNLDAALLRPGRIDRKVYISLPDSDTREQILKIALRDIPSSDLSLSVLSEALDGRSGAEVVAAVKESVLRCLSQSADHQNPSLSMEHLLYGAKKVQPRTSKSDLEFFKEWGAI